MSNSEQEELWNGRMGTAWVSVEERIDKMLSPLSSVAIERANVQPGERVIDIGCGCGPTSYALSANGASVWGVDISTSMVEQAQQRYGAIDNLQFSVMDAATADYTPDHDCLFSRFGMMFFSNPVDAFSNLRTALKPDGRIAFLCWQTPKDNPWISMVGAALQSYLPDTPAPDPRAPGPFCFADKDYIQEVFGAAGYNNIEIEAIEADVHLGDSVDEAMIFQKQVGPLSALLEGADDDIKEQATQAVVELLNSHLTTDGLNFPAATWLITGKAN
jgi:SAM-dependent methyltransferase